MHRAGIYKIGLVSRRTGLSPATLRLWEDHYSLLRPERSPRGTRLYSQADVERVLYIRELVRTEGYSLKGIAAIVDGARHGLPPVLQRLASAGAPDSQQAGPSLRRMVNDVRSLLEDAHLRSETNRERIRQAQLLTELQGVLRRVAGAQTFQQAASVLVSGGRELTGIQRVTLAIYEPADDTLATVAGVHSSVSGRSAVLLTNLPHAWERSLREKQPYYRRELQHEPRTEALPEVLGGVAGSVYWQPLTVGSELVGVLTFARDSADEITPEAQESGALLAVPAGPALAYFILKEKMAREGSGRSVDAPAAPTAARPPL